MWQSMLVLPGIILLLAAPLNLHVDDHRSCTVRADRNAFSEPVGEITESSLDHEVDRTRQIVAGSIALSCGDTGENLDPLVDIRHRPDVEITRRDRVNDIVTQHEISDVLNRDEHPLLARQPTRFTNIVEALDL